MGAEHPRGASGTHLGVCVHPPHPRPVGSCDVREVWSWNWRSWAGSRPGSGCVAQPRAFQRSFLGRFGGFWLLGPFVAHVGKELEGVCKQQSVCVPSAPWSVTPGMGDPRDGSPWGQTTPNPTNPRDGAPRVQVTLGTGHPGLANPGNGSLQVQRTLGTGTSSLHTAEPQPSQAGDSYPPLPLLSQAKGEQTPVADPAASPLPGRGGGPLMSPNEPHSVFTAAQRSRSQLKCTPAPPALANARPARPQSTRNSSQQCPGRLTGLALMGTGMGGGVPRRSSHGRVSHRAMVLGSVLARRQPRG